MGTKEEGRREGRGRKRGGEIQSLIKNNKEELFMLEIYMLEFSALELYTLELYTLELYTLTQE